MKDVAQGFVEVSSYVASIEAADAMAKAADVVIRRVHKADGPILCIVCEGDVAACKAAVDAAAALCSARGTLLAVNVIPRPEGGGQLLYDCLDGIEAKKAAKKKARLAARKAATKTSGKAAPKDAPAGSVKRAHDATDGVDAVSDDCENGPCCLLDKKPAKKQGKKGK
ncbi:BMC domain-containing protein [Desulfovibrio sp. OttesenSCG-928-C06]|nr:BMC domain-containing protein [Desulfovibrio sp. OttesenSCG-928-C06]